MLNLKPPGRPLWLWVWAWPFGQHFHDVTIVLTCLFEPYEILASNVFKKKAHQIYRNPANDFAEILPCRCVPLMVWYMIPSKLLVAFKAKGQSYFLYSCVTHCQFLNHDTWCEILELQGMFASIVCSQRGHTDLRNLIITNQVFLWRLLSLSAFTSCHTKDDGFQTLLVSGSNLRSAISNWYFRDIQFHGVSILEEPNENPTCVSKIIQGRSDNLHVWIWMSPDVSFVLDAFETLEPRISLP